MVSLVYYVIGGTPSTPVLFVFLRFLIVHHGIELVNQAHDYLEDKETGLLTPSVGFALKVTLRAKKALEAKPLQYDGVLLIR